jgi:hypothetical protein
MSSVDGALLVAASVEVDGADPQPNNDTGGSLQDLVMRGTGIGVPRRAAPGDAAPAPGSSRATAQGCPDRSYWATSVFHPCLSTGG